MVKDKILFGTLIGLLATLAMDLLQIPLWKLKIISHPLAHYAGSLFADHYVLNHTF
ncbi:MAG TPA: hypothetical protein GX391_08665 [Firmicutes bacterium]|jgi:hypothetical protein|nr:hypothetical protein [Bacillota bacterium]HOQ24980.1 hypothetical protein [Bacillota bacterium]